MKKLVAAVLGFIVVLFCFVAFNYSEKVDSDDRYATKGYKSSNKEFDLDKMPIIENSEMIDFIIGRANSNEDEVKFCMDAVDIEGIKILPDIRDDVYESGSICVQNSKFQISDELLKDIYDSINGYGARTSFCVVSMDDNMSFGYNPDITFQTASTVKAPFALYCFKKISEGKASLSEKIIYEPRFYVEGAGVIPYNSAGTEYTIEELLFNTIHYSDNTSYSMIHNYLWDEGYNEMLKELGCKEFYLKKGHIWGQASARSSVIIWQDIYNFSEQCDEGQSYLNMLKSTQFSYIRQALEEYEVASKYGWIEEHCHDTGIVFGEKPYIIAIMTDNGGNWAGSEQVIRLSTCIDKVMKEYNQWLNNRISFEDKIQ